MLARGFNEGSYLWEAVPADQIFQLRYGKALVEKDRKPGKIPVYGTNGRCGWNDVPLFRGPGVILGRKGQGPLGVEWCEGDYWVIDTGYTLELLAGNVDLKYAYYMIKFVGLNHLKDGTSNPTLSRDSFGSQEFPIPSLTVQREIVSVLDAIDGKIALLQRSNGTLDAIAQAIFKSWFVDYDLVRAKAEGRDPEGVASEVADLFPSEFEESELGMIPKGWKAQRLSHACEINPSRRLAKGSESPYLEMSAIRTHGHRPKSPVLRVFSSGTKFINGDSLLARITPCLENGKSAFVDFLSGNEVGWGSTEYIVLRPKAPLPNYWGYLLCRHEPFRQFAIQAMVGTSGRQRVEVSRLAQYPVAVPDPRIATAFAGMVEPLRIKIAANDDEAKTLTELRDTLLPRLMSGELQTPSLESI